MKKRSASSKPTPAADKNLSIHPIKKRGLIEITFFIINRGTLSSYP